MKRKIQIVLSLAILGLGVYYFSQKGAELSQLRQMTLGQFAMASLTILLYNFIVGLKLKQMLLSQKVHLTPSEWFGLPNIRRLGNLFFFKSGTVSNAYYLKSKHNLSYSKFVVIFTAEKITTLYATALVGLVISIFFFVYRDLEFYIVAFFICLSAGLTYFLFFLNFEIPEYNFRLSQKVSRVLKLWHDFKNERLLVYQLIILQFFCIHAFSLRLFIIFNILNQPISFLECVIMTIAITLSGFINLVPGGLGIREGTVGLTAQYLGHQFDFGVIATIFDRILATLWSGVFGIIFFHVLSFKRYEKNTEILTELK